MTGRLDGKAAVVLGAAGPGNMGQVIARRLRAEGAEVAVAGRRMESLHALAGEIEGHALACDITDKDQVEALAAQAKAAMGHVDIAVNSTGWGLLKPFLETTSEELDQMDALQFKGPFFFLQAMVGVMARSHGGRGGSIVQISSATAKIMLNDHAAYMGAKAGTDHVVRVVAHEFGADGVRANSISPGLTDTPMNAAAKEVPGLFDAFLPSYPLGRIGTSEDVAAAVVWLASDECFMTGENLQVNGGLTLRRNPTREEMQRSIETAARAS